MGYKILFTLSAILCICYISVASAAPTDKEKEIAELEEEVLKNRGLDNVGVRSNKLKRLLKLYKSLEYSDEVEKKIEQVNENLEALELGASTIVPKLLATSGIRRATVGQFKSFGKQVDSNLNKLDRGLGLYTAFSLPPGGRSESDYSSAENHATFTDPFGMGHSSLAAQAISAF